MLKKKGWMACVLILSLSLLAACATPAEETTPIPAQTTEKISETEPVTETTSPPETELLPSPAPTEITTTPAVTPEPVDEFTAWWQEYRQPWILDGSAYPEFYRGAWGSRLDELRTYLLHASELRQAGFDTIMVGVDVVFDPVTREARSLGDDIFIFYLQALKKEGFRTILVPNPMHPNLDMGLGYEWEDPDPQAGYHRSYELINKLNPVIIKWAKIAEELKVDGFAPCNEPYKLVRDYQDASRWLQEILPRIKDVYHGQVWAVDTMHDIGQGQSIPYPYDYRGYDMGIGGPPAGWKDVEAWEEMAKNYVRHGYEYVADYSLKGFGIYEWGAYTGGIWYEDGLGDFDQILNSEQAAQIVAAVVRQAEGKVNASFTRVSTGWLAIGTPAFTVLSDWYLSIGGTIVFQTDTDWTYDKLIEIEKKLGGDDYKDIFQIEYSG